jgi:hypothetical protein
MCLLPVLYFCYLSAFNSFRDTLIFDKRPFSRSNATIAIFYTVAEKLPGSSNLKKQVAEN